MRSLVTGGAGFIGSHVARHCLELGHNVVVLDDLSGGCKENLPPGAEFVQGSITDYDLLADIFNKHKFNYVYHLAAYAAEGLSHFIRRFNYTNNLLGSVNLLNQSVKHAVKCFVFTSSIAVYGEGQLPMNEGQTPQPMDPYGISKYAFELDLRSAHDMFGLNYVIFRPHNVYGENQNIGDAYRNVIGIFMNQVMRKQSMTIFGDGRQTRAFSYINDVAPGIARSAQMPQAFGEVFNVGSGDPHTVLELAHMVAKVFNAAQRIEFLPARQEVTHAYADHEKFRRVFGRKPAVPLEEGISRMAEWARKRGPQLTPPFAAVEIVKNMPEKWRKLLIDR